MTPLSRLATRLGVAALPTLLVLTTPVTSAVSDSGHAGESVAPRSVTSDVVTYPLHPPTGPERGLTADELAEAAEHLGEHTAGHTDGHTAGRAQGGTLTVHSVSATVTLPDLAVAGVTWARGTGAGSSVQYRTTTRGTWGEWSFIDADSDDGPDKNGQTAEDEVAGAREGTVPIIITGAGALQVRLLAPPSSRAPVDATLTVVDPGSSPADASVAASAAGVSGGAGLGPGAAGVAPGGAGVAPGAAHAAVTRPRIHTRSEWGADETLRAQSSPLYGRVDAAFVHHTVGTNDYTQAQVPAILRGIYSYHVKGQRWRDIGYNFLVDKFGTIWEGRYGGMDRAVVGAQASGVNEESFGVSVLGNHEVARPSTATLDALARLIAWKADLHDLDVTGTVTIHGRRYNVISGHRDAHGNSTACPGRYLYELLPEVRTRTAAKMAGPPPPTRRVAGADRYETAAALSARNYGRGTPVAYVATGADFPDALAGGPAGGHLGGPILLTKPNQLPSSTAAELKRLQPRRIVVLGGGSVVTDSVLRGLRSYTTGAVTRIAGHDRYETAARASAETFGTNVRLVYIATGKDFPDALAAGPAGGYFGGPVLLTQKDSLPPVTRAELGRLKPRRIVVLGGTGAVSPAVFTQVRQYAADVVRRSGGERFTTAARMSAAAWAPGASIAYVATGADFPDALAAGPAGAKRVGPVLLTNRGSLPAATISELRRLRPQRIVVLGGEQTVSAAVAKQLESLQVP